MGVSLSWIGVHPTTTNDLYTKLGLSETGRAGDYYDFPIAGQTFPSGWCVLIGKQCDHPILSNEVLSVLSAERSVIACSIEEHVMHMSAALWHDGRETWSMQHRGGDYGIMDLVVKGAPPDSFGDLRAHYFTLQEEAGGDSADVDHIADIPLRLAQSFVGFKHDEFNRTIDDGFRELRQEPAGLLAQAGKAAGKATRTRRKFW